MNENLQHSTTSNIIFHDERKSGSIGRKRKKILNEIYETERTYQHHLLLITTLFLEPIRVSTVLPPRVTDGIFSNVEDLQRVSTHLLELMEEEGITQALLQLAPYMKLYSLYANNFNNANKLLEEQQAQNRDFCRLLKFQESREEMQSLKFSALLVTPIQRVPRYRLLLQNLLDKTYEDDPVYIKLRDAFEEISRVTTHINECVRQHENFHKMLSIQNSFTGSNGPKILAPGRHFIREGVVTKITDRGNAKERTLFLFNDLLLCAKKETSCTYKCCDILPLVNCIVEQVMGSQSAGSGLFKVICKDYSILLCSKEDAYSWCSDIKKTVGVLLTNLASLKRLDNGSVALDERRKGKDRIKSPTKGVYPSSSRLKRIPNIQKENTIAPYDLQKRWTCPEIFHSDNNNSGFDITQDDRFYKLSSSTHSEKQESSISINDEVFLSTQINSSRTMNPIINWTLSEPLAIECRRPLHSLKEGARSIGGKLGCNSTKRKRVRHNSLSPYSKEKCPIKRKSVSTSALTPTSCVLSPSESPESDVQLPASNTGAAATGNSCSIM